MGKQHQTRLQLNLDLTACAVLAQVRMLEPVRVSKSRTELRSTSASFSVNGHELDIAKSAKKPGLR